MKLSTVQSANLANVKAANKALRQAKIGAADEAKRIVAEIIAGHSMHQDRMIRIAVDSGVPKSQVGQIGLGTKDTHTVTDSLERTAQLSEEVTPESVDRYRFTGNLDQFGRREISVTMIGDDWDEWITEKRAHGNLRQPALADLTTATFFVTEDGKVGTSEPDSSGAIQIDHPVVGWHKANKFQEVSEWAAKFSDAHS